MRAPLSIVFGPFTLDLEARLLTRRGDAVLLSGKAFELLALLARTRPKAMSKKELHDALWPSTFVSEANLSNLVAEIRAALGDNARAPIFIRTAHRFGYAFCGDVRTVDVAADSQPDSPVCWIEWGRLRFPLWVGNYTIGRDEGADIRIDASTVSRQHAQVIVESGVATLRDCGSKNGTFRGDRRVTASTTLVDGDALRIGTVLVTFYMRSCVGTTRTAGTLAT